MSFARLSNQLCALDQPIQVGIVGMGAMGRGILHQCTLTPGIQCVGIADIKIDSAIACAVDFELAYQIVDDDNNLVEAINRNQLAICSDGQLLAQSDSLDVLIPSCNSIAPALSYSTSALNSGKHLVLMNSEIDLTFGPYLKSRAKKHGVVCTSCDGDQHTVLKRMIDEIEFWGVEIVMAGNIKGFLDRYANPTTIVPEADKRNLDYRMATAYTDGTKLCIEMAIVANSLGYKTLQPGMSGPRLEHVNQVFEEFDYEKLWECRETFVDYILGAQPGGGVFVVGHCKDLYQQQMLKYYKLGHGPFYLFYRPYHLCHIEALVSVAEAVLDGRSLMEPAYPYSADVYAYAKRDIAPGEKLDGLGGYTCYGMIENCQELSEESLPICLSEGAICKRQLRKDGQIRLQDVEFETLPFELEIYLETKKQTQSLDNETWYSSHILGQ